MKSLLVLSLLCINSFSVPPQEKPKAGTVKKDQRPVKKKGCTPLYPSVLIVNTF